MTHSYQCHARAAWETCTSKAAGDLIGSHPSSGVGSEAIWARLFSGLLVTPGLVAIKPTPRTLVRNLPLASLLVELAVGWSAGLMSNPPPSPG
jgi:hypothetical protein